jgi:hypothetical protein
MNKTLQEMSEIELKAIGYDLVGQLEDARTNLNIINGELKRRKAQPVAEINNEKNETNKANGTDAKTEEVAG